MTYRIVLLLLFLGVFTEGLFSQSGMKYSEFAKKLEYYFEKELIEDIGKALPQGGNYSIWGWDVSDFSGDGNNDVAFAVYFAGEKKKVATVYMFIDIDGFLTLVGAKEFSFFELPLEVGVVIRNKVCYITQKNKQFDWNITGYRFIDGHLVLFDDFTTQRDGKFTLETYINYVNLNAAKKYSHISKSNEKFETKYMNVVSYPREQQIYKGFAEKTKVYDVENVIAGAWYWKGPEDGSYSIKSVYDDEFLYFSIEITDDVFVPQYCDTCPADNISLWFDLSFPPNKPDRFPVINKNKITYPQVDNPEIFNLVVYPGNFLDRRPYLSKVSYSMEFKDYQKDAIANIRLASSMTDSGYIVRIKIPWSFLGFDKPPVYEGIMSKIGFTAIFHDIDNEFRPEEETSIATSAFNLAHLHSFGELLFVQKGQWFGESKNIYSSNILKFLMELGF